MKYDDHCINLGGLWGVLQSLEVDLRLFLTQANPTKNYVTSVDTLGPLVGEYNRQLSEAERSLYFVDVSVVDIRNALAHGLVSGGRKMRFPLTLLHKGQQTKMTVEWFDDRRTLVRKQEERILACGKSRWPQTPWWGNDC